ncbi:uncharacterized protein BDW47DRAFT_121051 [Aspergillus candidus]|uniref:Uncharacterized protein n=1 Tax=Aspergillus candidus TaxID=41067 RepID=A0A2I2EZ34_ASPCN|nr:hypothetical protein BDW47DRAFT_121051 [Aspergillus candidus]PLB33628.1 hypothetical protein BDW47DRAFT_121051 [Aspergillus candidus]
MHLLSLLAASLLSATALARNPFIDYFCDLAADNTKFIQQPYCCSDLVPARNNDKGMMGDKCEQLDDEHVIVKCKDGTKPVCCYTVGPKYICTTVAQLETAADE